MIANSEKQSNGNNKELGYINYHRTKSVTTQPIFCIQFPYKWFYQYKLYYDILLIW